MKTSNELTAGFGSRVPQFDLAEVRASKAKSQPWWRLAFFIKRLRTLGLISKTNPPTVRIDSTQTTR